MTQTKPWGGHAAALVTILIWGTTFLATKVLLDDLGPLDILALRFALGYLALWVIRPKLLPFGPLRQELLCAGAGLCGVTLYFLMENIALTYTMASNVGIIVSISPMFTACLSRLFLPGTRLSRRFFLGLAAALGGVALIAVNGSVNLRLDPRGDLLAAGAAVAWACYCVLTKKLSDYGLDTVLLTRRIFFYGLLFMLPILPLMGFAPDLTRLGRPEVLLNLLYLGLGASALCFVTWNWAVKTLGPVRTSVYIYLVPLVTVVSSAILLKEPFTPMAAAGTALTLLGLSLSGGGQEAKDGERTQGELPQRGKRGHPGV